MLESENRNCNCGYNNNYMMNNNSNMMVDNNDYPNANVMSAGIGRDNENGNCCGRPGCAPKIPMYSFEFTNIDSEDTCEEKQMTRQEMLNQIRALDFAVVELAEYLDTHEDDQKALCLHREYSTKLKELKDKYQKVYGPLSIYFPCNKWRWLEEPWPSFFVV